MLSMNRRQLLGLLPALGAVRAPAQSFDHAYASWDALLKKHVRWLPDQKQSRVAYAGMAADRPALKAVLSELSAVSPAAFGAFTRPQQMAFLINAYNAFTVELILTAYPKLKSIKDLGSFTTSPWKKPFFTLLGEQHHLDWRDVFETRNAILLHRAVEKSAVCEFDGLEQRLDIAAAAQA